MKLEPTCQKLEGLGVNPSPLQNRPQHVKTGVSEEGQKTCFKCGETLPRREFYRHKMMGDGLLGKCKNCTKRDVSERIERLRTNSAWVLKERARCRKKTSEARSMGASFDSPAARKRWQLKNKHKMRAQGTAARYARLGMIEKKNTCEICDTDGKLHMHHFDYDRPIDVVWLCHQCHGLVHRKKELVIAKRTKQI